MRRLIGALTIPAPPRRGPGPGCRHGQRLLDLVRELGQAHVRGVRESDRDPRELCVSSTGRVAFGLNLPVRKPDSKRLNHGSKRIVLLAKLISQPSVPNHLKFTLAAPGPPLLGGASAPSARPGDRSDLPESRAVAAKLAASPVPRNCCRETLRDSELTQDGSTKHMVPPFR